MSAGGLTGGCPSRLAVMGADGGVLESEEVEGRSLRESSMTKMMKAMMAM